MSSRRPRMWACGLPWCSPDRTTNSRTPSQRWLKRADALVVCADPWFNSRREQLVVLAAHHRVPAIYEVSEYALHGGLMSYGVNIVQLYREVGSIPPGF